MFWLLWLRSRFASVEDYFCGAFVHGGFGLLCGLVFIVIQPGKVVLDLEYIGLLCTQAAADAADFAHRASDFARLLIAARNR